MASVGLLLALARPTCAGAAPRALPTVVQDDAQLLFRSDAQVRASMAKLQALGVQWIRVTASWSDLTREPTAAQEPAFDDRDPAAYERRFGLTAGGAFQRCARRGRGVARYRLMYVNAAGRHAGIAVPLA
jgi:hypothetical protein